MTKYCLLDRGDIVGPFSAQELTARAGFGPHSLVCPAEHTAEGEHWKEAYLYEEFNFEEEKLVEQAAETLLTIPLDQLKQAEIDRAGEVLANQKAKKEAAASQPVQNTAASSVADTKPSLLVEEKTVLQDNPIEEYFNTMREGDLGNILGIPDKTNSDLDLARALEKQFSKTDPQLQKSIGGAQPEQKDPFDEFSTPAAATEKKAEVKNSKENAVAAEALDLQTAVSLSLKETEPDKPSAKPIVMMPEQKINSEQAKQKAADTKLAQENKQPAPRIVKEPEPASVALSAPKSNKKSKLLSYFHWPHLSLRQYVFVGAALIVGLLVLGALWSVWAYAHRHPTATAAQPAKQPVAAEPMPETQPLTQAVPVATATPKTAAEELAQDIVKQHILDEERGTIEEYLTKKYAAELASGYTAMWAAEPLHSNSYVVRYRLVKARKEPIVYVFQADTAKKKLTGALNNITLDLVGKIN